MVFASPFFSRSGQAERLRNVGQTLTSAVTGKGVIANTPSATANRLLGAAASNPFVTALGGAAAAAPKAALGAASSAFSALPAGGKVAAVIAAPVAAGAVVTNPSLIGKAATAPRELSQFGSDIGRLTKDPTRDNLILTIQESPLISGTLGAGILLGLGAAGRTAATIANTAALDRAADKVVDAATFPPPASATEPAFLPEAPSPKGKPEAMPESQPITRETQVLGREPSSVGTRKPRKKASAQPIRNTVRVQVLNQQTYIQRR